MLRTRKLPATEMSRAATGISRSRAGRPRGTMLRSGRGQTPRHREGEENVGWKIDDTVSGQPT